MDFNKVLNDTVKKIPPSGIRKFFDLANEMEGVISLGVGEPDFDTPWKIREAAIYSIELGIIDTKCYDLSEIMPLCREISETLNLKLKILEYPIDYIEKLLTGPWDEKKFVVIKKEDLI